MNRDVTAALRRALQGHLSLRKSRLESFCVLVVGVLLSRTVQFAIPLTSIPRYTTFSGKRLTGA